MRELTDHIVGGDSANSQLKVQVMDAPGAGGANHRYEVTGFDSRGNPSAVPEEDSLQKLVVLFQNGPIGEAGLNGVTIEVMAAIIIDRLRGFESGKYACPENEAALYFFCEGLRALQERTRGRMARGVEGTHRV